MGPGGIALKFLTDKIFPRPFPKSQAILYGFHGLQVGRGGLPFSLSRRIEMGGETVFSRGHPHGQCKKITAVLREYSSLRFNGIGKIQYVTWANVFQNHQQGEPAVYNKPIQAFFALQQMSFSNIRLICFSITTPNFERMQSDQLIFGLKSKSPLRPMLHRFHRFQADNIMHEYFVPLCMHLRIKKEIGDRRFNLRLVTGVVGTLLSPIRNGRILNSVFCRGDYVGFRRAD